MNRELDALGGQTFDLLILGGGITGAGVALDATLRGLRVALIDKGDFASGTSSISSKLVHGGLRYLEHGDVRLVYEALQERGRLLRNAPHLAWPLRFVLPFYRGTRIAAWKWRAGLLLYDLLAGAGNIHRARAMSALSLQREVPGLRGTDLLGGAEFFDAQMDDARLCIEVLRTAASQGTTAANYVEAMAFDKAGGRIIGIQARDRLSDRVVSVRARVVLNATGPWSDAVRHLAGDPAGPLLRPTKGVHLIAPARGLKAALLLLHPADGRVFFVIPWLGKTLIGTTDTEAEAGPDQVAVTAADIRYLLEGHNHYLDPPLNERDLVNHFVGLRPLLHGKAADPTALSREFQVTSSLGGLITVAGGKYTTFRHMAEVCADAVTQQLGSPRRCRTRTFPLDGTPRGPWSEFRAWMVPRLMAKFNLGPEGAGHLVARYGRRAEDVAQLGGNEPVLEGEPDLHAEFVYHRDQEMAMLPADFLLRRTRLGLFHPELLHPDKHPEYLLFPPR